MKKFSLYLLQVKPALKKKQKSQLLVKNTSSWSMRLFFWTELSYIINKFSFNGAKVGGWWWSIFYYFCGFANLPCLVFAKF